MHHRAQLAHRFRGIRDTFNREKPPFHEPRECNVKPVNALGRQVHPLQFSAGRSICSITMVSTGDLIDSNLSPSCSRSAVKSEGPEDSEEEALAADWLPLAVRF